MASWRGAFCNSPSASLSPSSSSAVPVVAVDSPAVWVGGTSQRRPASVNPGLAPPMPRTNSDRWTVFDWNQSIAGFSRAGRSREALVEYGKMLDAGVQPNKHTFLSILKGCNSLEDVKQIHANILQHRCESDVFVFNTLIHRYASCGSIVDARNVFDTLSDRSVVSWNAMVAGYVEQEQPEKALQLYDRMQEEGVRPTDRTFVSVIKACSSLATREPGSFVDGLPVKKDILRKGRAVYAQLAELGYASNVFIGCTAVDMFASCGSIVDARHVFDALPERDVATWNAMIAGYVELEEPGEALELHFQMKKAGIRPDVRTHVSVLKACSILAGREPSTLVEGQSIKVESLRKGKAVVAEVVRRGHSSNVFLRSALVNMYAACGKISDAREVFDSLSEHDVVLWNAMIAGYAENEQGEEALQLFYQMKEKGVRPNDRTFVSALKACSCIAVKEETTIIHGEELKVQALQKGRDIYADVVQMGYETDVFVGTSALCMFASCGSIQYARHLFDSLSLRNVVTWNAMIGGYAEQVQGEEALQLFLQMQEAGVTPNERTFVNVLTACSTLAAGEASTYTDGLSLKLNALEKGKAVHKQIVEKGLDLVVFVANSIIHMYATCGDIREARHVFDALPHRTVVSWNAMIAGYAEQDHADKAVQLYAQMRAEDVSPDESTFVCILRVCSNSGALSTCHQIYHHRTAKAYEWNTLVGTAFIHAYGKCGSMLDAWQVFVSLPQPDAIAWSAIIAGYARQGECDRSFECFDQMLQSGMLPNAVTFVSLLTACSHAGLVDKGLSYFDTMVRDYGITAEPEHYACVIDLLGRAGLLSKAEELVLRMPMEPDLTVWLTLLGACQKFGNVEVGRRAFDCAVKLDPKQPSLYVLMANTYNEAGMWEHAKGVHEMRHREGAVKKPGQSWIEYGHTVQLFRAGDQPGSQLREKLDDLISVLTANNQY